MSATVQRYRDVDDHWRWRLVDDGHVLASASEPVATETALKEAIEALRGVVDACAIHATAAGCVLHTGPTPAVIVDPEGTRRLWSRDGGRPRSDGFDPDRWTAVADAEADEATAWASAAWSDLAMLEADPGVFVCHQGHDGEWRWRLFLDVRPVADSGEGYADETAAKASARRTAGTLPEAPLERWG